MNQTEEKLKYSFLAFLRGLRGIKNFINNMKIANLSVFPRLHLLHKLDDSDVPIWRKVEKPHSFLIIRAYPPAPLSNIFLGV